MFGQILNSRITGAQDVTFSIIQRARGEPEK